LHRRDAAFSAGDDDAAGGSGSDRPAVSRAHARDRVEEREGRAVEKHCPGCSTIGGADDRCSFELPATTQQSALLAHETPLGTSPPPTLNVLVQVLPPSVVETI
jgi:hypothetical protein